MPIDVTEFPNLPVIIGKNLVMSLSMMGRDWADVLLLNGKRHLILLFRVGTLNICEPRYRNSRRYNEQKEWGVAEFGCISIHYKKQRRNEVEIPVLLFSRKMYTEKL